MVTLHSKRTRKFQTRGSENECRCSLAYNRIPRWQPTLRPVLPHTDTQLSSPERLTWRALPYATQVRAELHQQMKHCSHMAATCFNNLKKKKKKRRKKRRKKKRGKKKKRVAPELSALRSHLTQNQAQSALF